MSTFPISLLIAIAVESVLLVIYINKMFVLRDTVNALAGEKVKIIEDAATSWNHHQKSLEQSKKIAEEWRRRTRELEDGIRDGYGIQARVEKTIINCDFTKLELSVILAGVTKLMQKPDLHIDDAEFYLNLAKKIGEVVPKMEES
jgi:hypothetical protein